MTKEQQKISYHNYKIAKEYYNLQKGWVLHHKDPSWLTEDIERYIQWNVEDLEPMTKGDHQRLHIHLAVINNDTSKYGHNLTQEEKYNLLMYAKLPKSEEHKRKISEGNKGKHNNKGVNNPNYGKKHLGVGGRPKGCKATKGSSGMHWYTDGVNNILTYSCPEGFTLGRTVVANTEVTK